MDVSAGTPSTPSDSASENTDQIPGGRYHIVERLSTGAIGAVYKALDTILDRPVAVKCVRLDTPFADQTPDELRERFVREARIAARLQHPNIVTIHDIVATPDRGYIIMEFIQGKTLESLLASEGRLPLSTAIRILSQLAEALDYAHGCRVVHRDVKPSNILVSPSMYAWVTDFGIAKSELSTNLTMAGGVLGAPDYMSPEQAKGEDVDARSDLFSLGCILFECAVGEKPFRSPSLTGVLLSIINDEPVFPLNWRSLGLPNELKPILHHALEKDPASRYESGAAMLEALRSIPLEDVAKADATAGSPGVAPAESPPSDAAGADEAEASDDNAKEPDATVAEEDAKKASPEIDTGATIADPDAVAEALREAEGETPRANEELSEPRLDEAEAGSEDDEVEARTESAEHDEPETAETEDEDEDAEGDDESTTRAAGSDEEASDDFASMLPAPELVAAVSENDEDGRDGEEALEAEQAADSASLDADSEMTDSERETLAMPTFAAPSEVEEPPEAEADEREEARDEETDDDATSDANDREAESASSVDEKPRSEEPEAEETERSQEPEEETAAPAPSESSPETSNDDVQELDPAKVEELKNESQVLHLAPELPAKLQGLSISPEEGFILSRIDGASRPGDVLSVSPMPEADTARALLELLEKGLIRLGGVSTNVSSNKGKPEAETAPIEPTKPEGMPDDDVVKEAERLLALAADHDWAALLDVRKSSSEKERKKAYLKIVGKFHPDRYPAAESDFREKLSRLCAAASEAVTEIDNQRDEDPPEESPRNEVPVSVPRNGSAVNGESSSSGTFDKKRYARELYGRALTAFEHSDYWEAIQLGRQTVEADEDEAEYFALLGRALMQNKKWRKEAADNFRKASDKDPHNVEYLGLLGAIYKAEGLATRANALLEKARTLDPDYELPELEPEPEVS